MRVLLSLAILVMLGTASKADVIFNTVASKSTITLGESATFNIFVRSNAGPITIGGMDATAIAGSGDGKAGTITLGSTFVLGNTPFGLNKGGPGRAVYGHNSNNFLNLDSNNVLFATLTLSTIGAIEGNYQFRLNNTFVVSDLSDEITSMDASPVSYSISAVPEPSSMALLGIIGAAAGARRWYKKRKLATKS